ncbi:hypothetical protein OF83DRAFT_1154582 [Amylostereum chailletii]|nr:hypothetical protein OF83DRAFT_1154582 [Amylostereum chailletii]
MRFGYVVLVFAANTAPFPFRVRTTFPIARIVNTPPLYASWCTGLRVCDACDGCPTYNIMCMDTSPTSTSSSSPHRHRYSCRVPGPVSQHKSCRLTPSPRHSKSHHRNT